MNSNGFSIVPFIFSFIVQLSLLNYHATISQTRAELLIYIWLMFIANFRRQIVVELGNFVEMDKFVEPIEDTATVAERVSKAIRLVVVEGEDNRNGEIAGKHTKQPMSTTNSNSSKM